MPSFQAEWKAMSLADADLKRPQEMLLSDPEIGRMMQGVGSVRVIYIDFEIREKLYLLTAYPKNEKDNLTKAERDGLKNLVHILETELEKNDERG